MVICEGLKRMSLVSLYVEVVCEFEPVLIDGVIVERRHWMSPSGVQGRSCSRRTG